MLSKGSWVRANNRKHSYGMAEPLHLVALGAVTYLSYWKLFLAVCRTCSGQGATSGR